MIVHVFNSSVVSGPETLVIPTLKTLGTPVAVVFLSETRCGDKSDGPPAYARSFDIDTYEIVVNSRWDRSAIKELSILIKKLNPKIVHAHEVKASAYVAAATSEHRKYRLFTTNHGVRAKKRPMLRFYEWLYTHWIMPKFDRVLCVCSSDLELLSERGVSTDLLRVHLNGIDKVRTPMHDRPSIRKRIHQDWGLPALEVPEDAIVLGVVGRLAPEKRHAYILEVFKALLKIYTKRQVHLVIFGRGALHNELATLTKSMGLEPHVHWLGYRASIGDENAGFDLMLSLSFAEGLPINLVEAGWAGTAVLATAVDGTLDLIPSPEFGITVSPEAHPEEVARTLALALVDERRLTQMGSALQSRVELKFSGSVWRNRLLALYAEQD